MILYAAARGDAQRAIADLVSQGIQIEVLGGRQLAAGHRNADHAGVRALRLGFAEVAVVLLIDAVEFEQSGGRFREGGGVLRQLVFQSASEVFGAGFEAFGG